MSRIALTFPEDNAGNQGPRSAGGVHDRASGKVHCTHLTQPSATPDPMGNRIIYRDRP
jgi:hypothetical protein